MGPAFELEHGERPVALDREDRLLDPSAARLARLQHLRLEAAAVGIALQHARDLGGPERRLVSARGAPHLDDHVLLVERILRRHRDAQLLLERRRTLLELGDQLAEIAVAAGRLEVVVHGAPLLRELRRLLELLQLAAALRGLPMVVVDGRIGHPLLQLPVGAFDLVDESLGSLRHHHCSCASSVFSTPPRAFDTGQFSFASSAAARNSSSLTPGTVPFTVSALRVTPVPGTNVTVAEVWSRSGACPAWASACERAIAKQVACAAASSSSGEVLPSDSSARARHDQARERTAFVRREHHTVEFLTLESGGVDANAHLRLDDQVTFPLDLVHHDVRGDVDVRVVAPQLAGDGHRETARVRRGEQLLRRRLALGPLADPDRQRVLEARERTGSDADRAAAARIGAVPSDIGVTLDSGHAGQPTLAVASHSASSGTYRSGACRSAWWPTSSPTCSSTTGAPASAKRFHSRRLGSRFSGIVPQTTSSVRSPSPAARILRAHSTGSCLPSAWNTAAAPSADARSRTRPSASTNTSRDKASAKSG